MYETLISLFVASATFFGNPTTPPEENTSWKIVKNWDGGLQFEASIPVDELKCGADNYLQLPLVQYGIQTISVKDFSRSFNYGDQAKNVYSKPQMKCDILGLYPGEQLHWKMSAYSLYYARVLSWPKVIPAQDTFQFAELVYVGSTFALFTLAFFMFVSFSNTSNRKMISYITLSAILFSFYFMLSAGTEFGIVLSFLTTHKVADIFLIGGIFSLFCAYQKLGLSSRKFLKVLLTASLASIGLVLLGTNGDQVQFGTTISYMIGIFGLLQVTGQSYLQFRKDMKAASVAILSCTLIILFGSIVEAAIVGGSIESMSYFPVFTLVAYTCFAISINQGIRITYHERDRLLTHMDVMIKERTAELHQALEEKDLAQAELIQKEKLASLGTLSAGIAHEINNSINYVNSCVIGLEKIIPGTLPENDKRLVKVNKLIDTARHGCQVTMDIVTSLRNFTGLNQAKFKKVKLDHVVDSVHTIVKSKIGKVKLHKEYDPEIEIYCSPVGMNQVIMNLITNAIDVVDPEKGEIWVKAHQEDDLIKISVIDNGAGIPEDKIKKIFDPFFTTKEVGKGTGLGLHIVHNEVVKRYGGKISVDSQIGQGSQFHIEIPVKEFDSEENQSAA